jgi:hypothetical protein
MLLASVATPGFCIVFGIEPSPTYGSSVAVASGPIVGSLDADASAAPSAGAVALGRPAADADLATGSELTTAAATRSKQTPTGTRRSKMSYRSRLSAIRRNA